MSAIVFPGGPGLGARTVRDLPLPGRITVHVAEAVAGSGSILTTQAAAGRTILEEIGESNLAVLVGHSFGVYPALKLAVDIPSGVAGLVLLAAQVHDGVDSPQLLRDRLKAAEGQAWASDAARALEVTPDADLGDERLRDLAVANLRLTFPRVDARHRAFLEQCAASWSMEVLRQALLQAPEWADATRQAVRVECPVLVVNGAEDPWCGEPSANNFGRTLRRARVVVLEDCGHVPWLDRPEEIRELLGDFLRGLEAE